MSSVHCLLFSVAIVQLVQCPCVLSVLFFLQWSGVMGGIFLNALHLCPSGRKRKIFKLKRPKFVSICKNDYSRNKWCSVLNTGELFIIFQPLNNASQMIFPLHIYTLSTHTLKMLFFARPLYLTPNSNPLDAQLLSPFPFTPLKNSTCSCLVPSLLSQLKTLGWSSPKHEN